MSLSSAKGRRKERQRLNVIVNHHQTRFHFTFYTSSYSPVYSFSQSYSKEEEQDGRISKPLNLDILSSSFHKAGVRLREKCRVKDSVPTRAYGIGGSTPFLAIYFQETEDAKRVGQGFGWSRGRIKMLMDESLLYLSNQMGSEWTSSQVPQSFSSPILDTSFPLHIGGDASVQGFSSPLWTDREEPTPMGLISRPSTIYPQVVEGGALLSKEVRE